MRVQTKLVASFLFSVFFVLAGQAHPNVGDVVVYRHLPFQNKKPTSTETQQEIVALNAKNGMYTFQTTTTLVDGTQKESQEQMAGSDILSKESIKGILSKCKQLKWSYEVIKVPAGTFKTCKMTSEGTTSWIANVPLGIVKFQSAEELFVLKSYQFAK